MHLRVFGVLLVLATAACDASSVDTTAPSPVSSVVTETPSDGGTAAAVSTTSTSTATTSNSTGGDTRRSTFRGEVWADNWFSLRVNGALIGVDSVPITTERSFNAETFEFEASYPLTIAIEAKDFKENDSGLEYVGTDRQQMGDGGLIAQITDLDTATVVAITDGSWRVLVIHRAPLDTTCERSAEPLAVCGWESIDPPAGWTEPGYDASPWAAATEWTEAAVDPKDGYDDITWHAAARLVWGSDLATDNTVLLRTTASG